MPRELREMIAATSTAALAPSSSPSLTTADTKVIVSLVLWFFLRNLQWILGPRRRLSGSWLVQYGAMAAYYLPTPLLFSAASSTVYSSPAELKALLVFYCYTLLIWSAMCGRTVMKAYTLSDGPLQLWRLLPWLFYIMWILFYFLFAEAERTFTLLNIAFFGMLCLIAVSFAVLNNMSIHKLDFQTKRIADYMVEKSESSSLFVHHGLDDNSVPNGCQYPVIVLENGTCVTIKDVLQLDWLPRQHQDTCLSYSFCMLLARRYFKFRCAEEGDAGVRNLVMTQLLSEYKRAFALVEVQLAFLHDHIFTDYPTMILKNNQSGSLVSGTQFCRMAIFCCTAIMLLATVASVAALLAYDIVIHHGIDVIAAVAPVVCLLEFLLKFSHILHPNYWHPVRQIFKYYSTATGRVGGTPTSGWLSSSFCQSSKVLGHNYYWRNKIGQYSLLADYDHHCSLKKRLINCFKPIFLSDASALLIKHLPAAKDDVTVPESVRKLVTLTLQRYINGPPTNGITSLRRNRDLVPCPNLLETCDREKVLSHTNTILIWHIATCYCDMFPVAEEGACDHHEAATALSKYCAYLVAFVPEFLPEHKLTTVDLLQEVLQSTKTILGPTRISMEQKRLKIQGLEIPARSGDAFLLGIYLGRRLMAVNDAVVCWKVLAEFWAETILYIAASNDATAHVEHLAKGGEFVTHLWAMLSNAGILKRAAEERTQLPPQQQQQHGATGEDRQRLRRSQSLPTRFGGGGSGVATASEPGAVSSMEMMYAVV